MRRLFADARKVRFLMVRASIDRGPLWCNRSLLTRFPDRPYAPT